MRITLSVKAFIACIAMVCCAPFSEAAERTVSVAGQGEVHAEPDRAVVSLGVESRNASLETSRGEVNRVVDGILKLTRELQIDPKFVRTTRLIVQPEYNWNNPERERRFLGYWVQRQVEVELRNLDQLGKLVERGVTLGANQVMPPQLDSSRRRDLEREALKQAMLDARANADVAARAAGAKLGVVQSIVTSAAVGPPLPRPMVQRAQMAAAEAEPESYRPGLLTFSATVQVVYALADSAETPAR